MKKQLQKIFAKTAPIYSFKFFFNIELKSNNIEAAEGDLTFKKYKNNASSIAHKTVFSVWELLIRQPIQDTPKYKKDNDLWSELN